MEQCSREVGELAAGINPPKPRSRVDEKNLAGAIDGNSGAGVWQRLKLTPALSRQASELVENNWSADACVRWPCSAVLNPVSSNAPVEKTAPHCSKDIPLLFRRQKTTQT
jgi:hypothetical protein